MNYKYLITSILIGCLVAPIQSELIRVQFVIDGHIIGIKMSDRKKVEELALEYCKFDQVDCKDKILKVKLHHIIPCKLDKTLAEAGIKDNSMVTVKIYTPMKF